MKLTLEESVDFGDQVFETGGVKFLLHANAIPYFNKVKIDFVQIAGNGNFKLINI